MTYHVDLNELDTFVKHLKKLTAELETNITDLNQYNTNLHLTWEGPAATAQAQAQHTIHTSLNHIHHALNTIADHTSNAHTHYTDAHTTDTATWATIQ